MPKKRKKKDNAVKKKRYGPLSLKSKARLPDKAHVDKRIQHQLNLARGNEALRKDRYGVRLMWKVCPQVMNDCGIKPMGSYHKKNIHGGAIWGWKHEVNLNEGKVKRILFACIESKMLTPDQLKAVRKSFSYAYQLQHGADFAGQSRYCNYSCVFQLWKLTKNRQCTPSVPNVPVVIASAKDLKKAFRKLWSPNHPWSFIEFCVGVVTAYDYFVFGCRSQTDLTRLKESRVHEVYPKEARMLTHYNNGRAKVRTPRPWVCNTVCFCRGGKHVSPHKDFKFTMDEGNPTCGVEWFSTCPLACFQFLQQYSVAKNRRYPKPSKHGDKLTRNNIGDVCAYATRWMIAQGVCPANRPYCKNSGRKSLAKLLSAYEISYEAGFEIHGDLPVNWKLAYQGDMPAPQSSFKRRIQSTNPQVACRGLRLIAQNFGLGVQVKPPMNRLEQFNYHILKHFNKKLANRIARGLPAEDSSSEDDDSDDAPLWPPKRRVKEEEVMPSRITAVPPRLRWPPCAGPPPRSRNGPAIPPPPVPPPPPFPPMLAFVQPAGLDSHGSMSLPPLPDIPPALIAPTKRPRKRRPPPPRRPQKRRKVKEESSDDAW